MTVQVKEKLILNGEMTTMENTPAVPAKDRRIAVVDVPEHSIAVTSACWRKYRGTWEVSDDRFYLVEIEGMYVIRGDAPVLADWFTGELVIPQGSVLEGVRRGSRQVHEQDLLISVENGVVINTQVRDNRNTN
jgi:hypothetical protein